LGVIFLQDLSQNNYFKNTIKFLKYLDLIDNNFIYFEKFNNSLKFNDVQFNIFLKYQFINKNLLIEALTEKYYERYH
jgi:hypothetical protein